MGDDAYGTEHDLAFCIVCGLMGMPCGLRFTSHQTRLKNERETVANCITARAFHLSTSVYCFGVLYVPVTSPRHPHFISHCLRNTVLTAQHSHTTHEQRLDFFLFSSHTTHSTDHTWVLIQAPTKISAIPNSHSRAVSKCSDTKSVEGPQLEGSRAS